MSMQVRVIKNPVNLIDDSVSKLVIDEDGDIWIQLVNDEEETIGYLLLGEGSDGCVTDADSVEREWMLEPFHGTIEITQ